VAAAVIGMTNGTVIGKMISSLGSGELGSIQGIARLPDVSGDSKIPDVSRDVGFQSRRLMASAEAVSPDEQSKPR
jgi:hypothetical protein